MKKTLAVLAFALASACLPAFAGESFSGNELAAEGAWCWFADPRAIHFETPDRSIDASYIGYIDVHGNIKATQYDFADGGKRSEVLVRSFFQPDDHNNPTFLVLPDKRVLIIYSRHTDEKAFYYRVSRRPGDISDLGEEKKIVTSANTTYPSPFILSDDPEHFYLCWRGINWHPTIARFSLPDENDEVRAEWGPFQIVQSTGARPYAKYYSNGKDKLYVTYTTGHPDNEQPNWIYFNAININAAKGADGTVTAAPTLEDINGSTLSVIADGTFAVNKTSSYKTRYPATVVDAPSDRRDWVWQIANAADGSPVIAMVRINGGKSEHEYHYARWTGSEWRVTFLANGGGRFHSSNTEYCYSGGMAIDPQNVNDIYLSIPTEGEHGEIYEIWKYTIDDLGDVKSTEQITRNSVKNNVRPYVLPDSKGSSLRVAWMNGDYYYWMVNKNYPAGYPTDIHSDYAYTPVIDTSATTPAFSKTYNTALTPAQNEPVSLHPSAFSVNITLTLSPDTYSGTIFTADGFKYGISASDQYPYVEIDGKTYRSSCRFLTSDDWATNSGGTNSDNWPTKIGSFDLSFTYDGTTLTVYRDGLIDQKIEAPALSVTNAAIGGFHGTLTAVSTYGSCLNQDELKYAQSAAALGSLSLPSTVHTDIALPSKAGSQNISWTSSHPEILSATGIYNAPAHATEITLTATLAGNSRKFTLTAEPRNLDNAMLAFYDFESSDGSSVPDMSGNNRHLRLMGSAVVTDGALDLTANKATAFGSNGYAVIPEGLLGGIRSYTVCFDATPSAISGAPRFYDFGSDASNSIFCRVNTLAAGIKYSGGSTTMVDAGSVLRPGISYKIAVSYSAATGISTIYVDGRVVAAGDQNKNEAYLLGAGSTDVRNYIGRTQWWDGTYAKDNVDYVGTIDNFRVYDTALTESELALIQGFDIYDPSLDTDMTSRLLNPGFEEDYIIQPGTNVDSDRAIYLPQGWTLTYENGNRYDLSIVDSSCMYANLFESIPAPDDGGEHTYRIRQRWGHSTISLSQIVQALPAACYTFSGMIYRQGNGVTSVFAANSAGTESAQPSASGTWTRAGVTFGVNGVESVSVGFTSDHPEEVEFITGYDNFTLTDITANCSATDIDALLSRMTEAADTLLSDTDSSMTETDRAALSQAKEAAEGRAANSSVQVLLQLYTALRDAITEARKNSSSVSSVAAPETEYDGPVYDISGRCVAPAMKDASLAAGIYLHNGKKIILK